MNDYEKYLRDESPTFMGEPVLNKQRNYPDAAAYAEATEGVDMADFQRKILATAAPILEIERAIRIVVHAAIYNGNSKGRGGEVLPEDRAFLDREETKLLTLIRALAQPRVPEDCIAAPTEGAPVQADAKDAARWRHIEMLWMLGDVELTTDEDAQFILCSNPAEYKSEAFTAIDPAATVDAGIAAIAARGAK